MSAPPTCQWCGLVFGTITAKLIHVHEEHPETIGRGHTISKNWACSKCGHDNPPVVHVCGACQTVDAAQLERNRDERLFLVHTRRSDGTIATTDRPIHYANAHRVIGYIGMLLAIEEGAEISSARAEVWDATARRRLVWLEAIPRSAP